MLWLIDAFTTSSICCSYSSLVAFIVSNYNFSSVCRVVRPYWDSCRLYHSLSFIFFNFSEWFVSQAGFISLFLYLDILDFWMTYPRYLAIEGQQSLHQPIFVSGDRFTFESDFNDMLQSQCHHLAADCSYSSSNTSSIALYNHFRSNHP